MCACAIICQWRVCRCVQWFVNERCVCMRSNLSVKDVCVCVQWFVNERLCVCVCSDLLVKEGGWWVSQISRFWIAFCSFLSSFWAESWCKLAVFVLTPYWAAAAAVGNVPVSRETSLHVPNCWFDWVLCSLLRAAGRDMTSSSTTLLPGQRSALLTTATPGWPSTMPLTST